MLVHNEIICFDNTMRECWELRSDITRGKCCRASKLNSENAIRPSRSDDINDHIRASIEPTPKARDSSLDFKPPWSTFLSISSSIKSCGSLCFRVPVAYPAHRLKLDPANPQLTAEQKEILNHNIQLLRDAIVLFTSTGAARGVSGHTGQYICSIGLSMGQISILIPAEIYLGLPFPFTF